MEVKEKNGKKNSENSVRIDYIKELNPNYIPSAISTQILSIIGEQAKNSICKIICPNNKGTGTGFLCKLPFPDCFNLLPVLATCYHVLEKENFINGSKITIQFNNEEKTNIINIDNKRKIYKSNDREYDIIFIEIKKDDGIDMKHFLDVDDFLYKDGDINNIYKNKDIYPKGLDSKISFGKVKGINIDNSELEHLCWIDLVSSGAPIFNILNYKILGIHKGDHPRFYFKLGNVLKKPIESFYLKEKNNIKLSEEEKNELENASDISKANNQIHTKRSILLGNYSCNFHRNLTIFEEDLNYNELYGISKLCLLKYISNYINDINIIQNNEIRDIIKELKEDAKMIGINYIQDPERDIKEILSKAKGNNISAYLNYYKDLVSSKEIGNLISLLDKNIRKLILGFWSILSKYQYFNEIFEQEFSKMIEKSYFEYSLIGVSIYQHRRAQEFLRNSKQCDNCQIKLLLHGTPIDSISKILTSDFKYSKNSFFGMGVYFEDMIDYMSYFSKIGKNGEKLNWGKILKPGTTISCVGALIFYDKDRKKCIYNLDYLSPKLDHFPTYEELQTKFKEKMVERNGVHFIRVGTKYRKKSECEEDIIRKEGKFIANEYVITEMDQILPLYGLTLRRNEYFILWRDCDFNKKNEFAFLQQIFSLKESKMNIYFENSTEKALEIIQRKKYNKIILIESFQEDVGKRFVDIARKILNFDIVVLFYSLDLNNLNWIQHFPNALFTNNGDFVRKYIANYNKNGLIQLKAEMEKYYKCRFNLNNNCLEYPYAKLSEKYCYDDLIFEEINPYFRRVIIKNRSHRKALLIEKRQVKFLDYFGIDVEKLIWNVTMINGEITLFSKGYYLYIDQNQSVVGTELMKTWKYEIYNSKYIFYILNKNFTLTVSDNNAILKNVDNDINPNQDQLFNFLDVFSN